MSNPETDARSAVQTFLNSLDLDDRNKERLYGRFQELVEEANTIARCDHENVRAHIDDRADLRTHVDPATEGVQQTFHGECVNCGAELDAQLVLTFNRGEDDE